MTYKYTPTKTRPVFDRDAATAEIERLREESQTRVELLRARQELATIEAAEYKQAFNISEAEQCRRYALRKHNDPAGEGRRRLRAAAEEVAVYGLDKRTIERRANA